MSRLDKIIETLTEEVSVKMLNFTLLAELTTKLVINSEDVAKTQIKELMAITFANATDQLIAGDFESIDQAFAAGIAEL